MAQFYSYEYSSTWSGTAKVASVSETPIPAAFWLFSPVIVFVLGRKRGKLQR